MGYFLLPTLLVAAFTVAFATNTPLCTPPQWESLDLSTTGYSSMGGSGIIFERVELHYDATNERIASVMYYHNGKYLNTFRTLAYYKGNVGRMFMENAAEKSCFSKYLNGKFPTMCIAPSAKRVSGATMGLGKYTLDVSIWMEDGGYYRPTTILKVLEEGTTIIPISKVVYASKQRGKVHIMQASSFYNIVGGIQNATVFDVPEDCRTDAPLSETEQMVEEHFLGSF